MGSKRPLKLSEISTVTVIYCGAGVSEAASRVVIDEVVFLMANVLIVDLMLTDSSSSCFSAADGIGRTKLSMGGAS